MERSEEIMEIQTKKDPEHVWILMLSFVAAIMFMTILKKPKLSWFLTTSEMFATPIFGKMMSRYRFFSISFTAETPSLKNHIIPKDADTPAQVRPLLLYLKDKWQRYFYLGKGIVVDDDSFKKTSEHFPERTKGEAQLTYKQTTYQCDSCKKPLRVLCFRKFHSSS